MKVNIIFNTAPNKSKDVFLIFFDQNKRNEKDKEKNTEIIVNRVLLYEIQSINIL